MRAAPILAALSASVFGVMAWLVATVLKPRANGLPTFDERVLGYTFGEARRYLDAIDSVGRATYLVEMRALDTIFPVVFALLLGHLTMRCAAWMHPWSRMILVLPAVGYAIMDLGENALVAELLLRGADGVTAEMVSLASEFTITKWVLLLISLVLLAVMWLVGRRKQSA